MIIEKAEIVVQSGKEKEFAGAMVKGVNILMSATGCTGVSHGRGIENPAKFILILKWESVDHHIAFTKTQDFGMFIELISPYFAQAPQSEHFHIGS